MKYLVCPQCGVDRFYVLNTANERVVVKVSREYEIIPLHDNIDLGDCDLSCLYCLG